MSPDTCLVQIDDLEFILTTTEKIFAVLAGPTPTEAAGRLFVLRGLSDLLIIQIRGQLIYFRSVFSFAPDPQCLPAGHSPFF